MLFCTPDPGLVPGSPSVPLLMFPSLVNVQHSSYLPFLTVFFSLSFMTFFPQLSQVSSRLGGHFLASFVDSSSTCRMTVDVKEMKIQILISLYVLVSFTLLSFLVLNFMSFTFKKIDYKVCV